MSSLVGYKRAKRKVVVQAFAILATPKFALLLTYQKWTKTGAPEAQLVER